MGARTGWVRLALALAVLVGLCGLAAPVAVAASNPGLTTSASTSPFDAPDLTLSDRLHARPIAATSGDPLSPAPPGVLFAVAALAFLALLGLHTRTQAPPIRFRPATPRRGRAPPTCPN